MVGRLGRLRHRGRCPACRRRGAARGGGTVHVARLFILFRQGTGWNVQRTEDSLIYRAKTIRSFQLIDLDGDGREEILVEGAKPFRNNPGPNESALVTQFNDTMIAAPPQ